GGRTLQRLRASVRTDALCVSVQLLPVYGGGVAKRLRGREARSLFADFPPLRCAQHPGRMNYRPNACCSFAIWSDTGFATSAFPPSYIVSSRRRTRSKIAAPRAISVRSASGNSSLPANGALGCASREIR